MVAVMIMKQLDNDILLEYIIRLWQWWFLSNKIMSPTLPPLCMLCMWVSNICWLCFAVKKQYLHLGEICNFFEMQYFPEPKISKTPEYPTKWGHYMPHGWTRHHLGIQNFFHLRKQWQWQGIQNTDKSRNWPVHSIPYSDALCILWFTLWARTKSFAGSNPEGEQKALWYTCFTNSALCTGNYICLRRQRNWRWLFPSRWQWPWKSPWPWKYWLWVSTRS